MKKGKLTEPADLGEEIRMLRDVIGRLYSQCRELEGIDELTQALSALGLASTRLNNLLQSQAASEDERDEKARQAAEALSMALDELAKEWGNEG
jgi:hypothetical protein